MTKSVDSLVKQGAGPDEPKAVGMVTEAPTMLWHVGMVTEAPTMLWHVGILTEASGRQGVRASGCGFGALSRTKASSHLMQLYYCPPTYDGQ